MGLDLDPLEALFFDANIFSQTQVLYPSPFIHQLEGSTVDDTVGSANSRMRNLRARMRAADSVAHQG